MSAIHSQCQEIGDSININQSCNPEKHRDPYSSFREAPAGKKAPLKRKGGREGGETPSQIDCGSSIVNID